MNRRSVLTALLTIALSVAGMVLLLHTRHTRALRAAQNELSAIADQRMRRLNDWRKERLSDGQFFSRAKSVRESVQLWLANSESEHAREAVLDWLAPLQSETRYREVMIYDARLQMRIAVPANAREPKEPERAKLINLSQNSQVVLTDVDRDSDDERPYCDVLFPIFEGSEGKGVLLAIGLLRINIQASLFQILQQWPIPSKSAETLLVRREGEDVVYLNELRHRSGTTLKLRRWISDSRLPAARILRGETRPFEGVDYRGVPVVAVGGMVSGTSWALVAKVDKGEIYGPVQWQVLVESVALGSVLLAGVMLAALLWQEQRTRLLASAASEWERTFNSVPDLISILDNEHRVVRVNRAMADRLHRSPAECVGAMCSDCVHGVAPPLTDCPYVRTKQDGQVHSAEIHDPKLGGDFYVTTTPIFDERGCLTGTLHVARDITERKKNEEAIKASLVEKEVLLKEVHHRVKNNMQVISSLVSLQASSLTDPASRAALAEIRDRVRSMALVHETLYQSDDLGAVDFAAYARNLLGYLWRVHPCEGDIKLVTDLEPVSITLERAVPCGLILNEVVTNALKHAFRGRPKGKVSVSARILPGGQLHLCVTDDGVGLPEDLDRRQSPSLGLRLVRILSKQLGAKEEFCRLDTGGTEFEIVIQVVKPIERDQDVPQRNAELLPK